MIDQAIYKIRDSEIFRRFMERKRKWRDIGFLVRYFPKRKCRKKIKEFVFRNSIYFIYFDGFDIFCQYPFEEKFVAIGDEIDGLVLEIKIV